MGIHCVTYYEEHNACEMRDMEYQCSRGCMMSTIFTETGHRGLDTAGTLNLRDGRSISWGAFPGGAETDYDVYCSTCEQLLWEGIA